MRLQPHTVPSPGCLWTPLSLSPSIRDTFRESSRLFTRHLYIKPASLAFALCKPQAPAAGNASSEITAAADRSTFPVVGLLQEAAQLGCSPGPETVKIISSLVGPLVGSTRCSIEAMTATQTINCDFAGFLRRKWLKRSSKQRPVQSFFGSVGPIDREKFVGFGRIGTAPSTVFFM